MVAHLFKGIPPFFQNQTFFGRFFFFFFLSFMIQNYFGFLFTSILHLVDRKNNVKQNQECYR